MKSRLVSAADGPQTRWLVATDNIIPMKYFREFLPELAKAGMTLATFSMRPKLT